MSTLKFKDLKHLPGDKGPFIVGYFNDFLSRTSSLWRRMQKKYGDVFVFRILHRTSVQLMSPKTNKLILVDNPDKVENKEAWETALLDLFPNSLMLMDGEEHKYHRRIMHDAFKKPAMKGYYTIMPLIIRETLSSLPVNQTTAFFPFYKLLTLRLATKVFFGLDKSDKLNEVNTAVTDIVNAAAAVPLKIPGTTFYKGIQGRKFLKAFFKDLIEERKTNPGDDLFSRLCIAKSEEGEQFTSTEIIDHLIFVLMAAHDTTAITLTFLSYFLAKHPDWQHKIRQQILTFDKGEEPASLRELTHLTAAIKETLRIHPPLTQVIRKMTADLDIEGVVVPKDAVVACVMQMTQMDDRIWTSPSAFDPDRFNAKRKEDKRCPFSYAPFGAGQHHCIGYSFAEMQIKLVMMDLLTNFELYVEPDYEPQIKEVPLKQPVDNMPILVKAWSAISP